MAVNMIFAGNFSTVNEHRFFRVRTVLRDQHLETFPVFIFANTNLDGESWSVRLSESQRSEESWIMKAEFLIGKTLGVGDSFEIRFGSLYLGTCTVLSLESE